MEYVRGLLGVLFVDWMGLWFVAELKVEKKYDRRGFVEAVLGVLRHPFNRVHDEEVRMSPKKATEKSAKSTGFTAEERAAIKDRAQELKAEARKASGESAVLAKIAEMPEPDRAIAERLHAIITASAPELSPKTWYGMPGYANKDGKVVCYFTAASKFKERYATFGFNAEANLDEGNMWPTSFALKELTADEEARIEALVKKAVS
jgi:uncharacterized protein YdhG (YjbR/CyaY superfamily)